MEYLDRDLLEAQRKNKRNRHTTLETGIYAGEELITFKWGTLLDSTICLPFPVQFVIMPEEVKNIKYPSRQAPEFIITNLESTVNIGFNLFPLLLQEGGTAVMSSQFQNALKNINPAIVIKNQTDTITINGFEMNWFDYKGYHLDGQSYNRIYIIRMRKNVLHGIFSCPIKDKDNWIEIIDKIFFAVVQDI